MSRIAAAVVASLITVAPVAYAQFSMPSIPGMGNKSAATGDLSGTQDQLVKQYVDANKTVLQGNAQMADAIGLKDQAAIARTAGESLGDGATKGNLSDADKVTSETSQKLTEKLNDKSIVLDADAKKKFAGSLVTMASALVKYVGLRTPVQSFSTNLKGASPMMLPKLQTGMYIATSLPGNVKTLQSALGNAVSFAKSHGVAVPSETTSALKFD